MTQKYLKAAVLFGILIGAVALYQSGIVTTDNITTITKDYPRTAPLVFMGVYMLATVFFLPATPLSLAAGGIFGPALGSVYILIGATIGATLAFLVARFLLQEWTSNLINKRLPRLQEYFESIKDNGFVTVLLLRLAPIFPFNGLNFALGVTEVKVSEYVLATALGIIPGVIILSFLGGAIAAGSVPEILIGVSLYILTGILGVAYNKYKKKTV